MYQEVAEAKCMKGLVQTFEREKAGSAWGTKSCKWGGHAEAYGKALKGVGHAGLGLA